MVSGYKEKNLHSIKMHYRSIINARDVQQQHVLPKTYYYVKRHDSKKCGKKNGNVFQTQWKII